MSPLDHEEQLFQADVKAVKQWWADSRWRYTKRPFTAEQIVAKRGNLKIEYPSNVQSKKLWQIVEKRFRVASLRSNTAFSIDGNDRMVTQASPMAAWNLQCSRRWRSTLILFTSPAGNAPPLPPRLTSHHLISLTIPW